jgi:hypothetical protein
VAGENKHYTDFVRGRPCAACGTTFGIEVHHALYGTTYSPDEPIPAKAIPNARKGAAQKSHDYFSISLCYKDHTPGLHKGNGYFAGKSGAWIEAWERTQVEEMHKLYDAEFPNGDPALVAKAERAVARKTSGPRDAVLKERDRVVRVIRARAAERQHLPDQHQLLAELADDIAGGLNETGAF